MRVTYFHWGFHGWAVYVMIGLCLAYFGFRKKLPLTLRSALYPIIGDRIYGPSAMLSTCWRSSARCSASPPRWVWVSVRWRPASTIYSGSIRARRPR